MHITVTEETAADLPEYDKVSIAFQVRSRFIVTPIENGLGGLRFIEESVEPYLKDYDRHPDERPSEWPRRFDVSNWAFLGAFDGLTRIGGAVVAWGTPGVDMLEGRKDLACLWDLRVHPEYRGKSVGYHLVQYAVEWAVARNCGELKVETQNINVPACRFYARQRFELRVVDPTAYGPYLEETQLVWYRDLRCPIPFA